MVIAIMRQMSSSVEKPVEMFPRVSFAVDQEKAQYTEEHTETTSQVMSLWLS